MPDSEIPFQKLDMTLYVVHTYIIPTLGKLMQEDHHEFEGSLGCGWNFRTGWCTE